MRRKPIRAAGSGQENDLNDLASAFLRECEKTERERGAAATRVNLAGARAAVVAAAIKLRPREAIAAAASRYCIVNPQRKQAITVVRPVVGVTLQARIDRETLTAIAAEKIEGPPRPVVLRAAIEQAARDYVADTLVVDPHADTMHPALRGKVRR